MHQRLLLAAIVVSRWSQNIDVIFIMFEMICTFDEPLIDLSLSAKENSKLSFICIFVFLVMMSFK